MEPNDLSIQNDIKIKQEPVDQDEEYSSNLTISDWKQEWFEFKCQSGEVLFYFNINSHEHRWMGNACTCLNAKGDEETEGSFCDIGIQCDITDTSVVIQSRDVSTEVDLCLLGVQQSKPVLVQTEITCVFEQKSFPDVGVMAEGELLVPTENISTEGDSCSHAEEEPVEQTNATLYGPGEKNLKVPSTAPDNTVTHMNEEYSDKILGVKVLQNEDENGLYLSDVENATGDHANLPNFRIKNLPKGELLVPTENISSEGEFCSHAEEEPVEQTNATPYGPVEKNLKVPSTARDNTVTHMNEEYSDRILGIKVLQNEDENGLYLSDVENAMGDHANLPNFRSKNSPKETSSDLDSNTEKPKDDIRDQPVVEKQVGDTNSNHLLSEEHALNERVQMDLDIPSNCVIEGKLTNDCPLDVQNHISSSSCEVSPEKNLFSELEVTKEEDLSRGVQVCENSRECELKEISEERKENGLKSSGETSQEEKRAVTAENSNNESSQAENSVANYKNFEEESGFSLTPIEGQISKLDCCSSENEMPKGVQNQRSCETIPSRRTRIQRARKSADLLKRCLLTRRHLPSALNLTNNKDTSNEIRLSPCKKTLREENSKDLLSKRLKVLITPLEKDLPRVEGHLKSTCNSGDYVIADTVINTSPSTKKSTVKQKTWDLIDHSYCCPVEERPSPSESQERHPENVSNKNGETYCNHMELSSENCETKNIPESTITGTIIPEFKCNVQNKECDTTVDAVEICEPQDEVSEPNNVSDNKATHRLAHPHAEENCYEVSNPLDQPNDLKNCLKELPIMDGDHEVVTVNKTIDRIEENHFEKETDEYEAKSKSQSLDNRSKASPNTEGNREVPCKKESVGQNNEDEVKDQANSLKGETQDHEDCSEDSCKLRGNAEISHEKDVQNAEDQVSDKADECGSTKYAPPNHNDIPEGLHPVNGKCEVAGKNNVDLSNGIEVENQANIHERKDGEPRHQENSSYESSVVDKNNESKVKNKVGEFLSRDKPPSQENCSQVSALMAGNSKERPEYEVQKNEDNVQNEADKFDSELDLENKVKQENSLKDTPINCENGEPHDENFSTQSNVENRIDENDNEETFSVTDSQLNDLTFKSSSENVSEVSSMPKEAIAISPGVHANRISPSKYRTNRSQRAKFACEICGRIFKQRLKFSFHMRGHKILKHQTCPYCLRTFRNYSLLLDHVRIHNQIPKYNCSYCKEGFISHQKLVAHFIKCSETKSIPRDSNVVSGVPGSEALSPKKPPNKKDPVKSTPPNKLTCKVCHLTYVYPKIFKKHLDMHAEITKDSPAGEALRESYDSLESFISLKGDAIQTEREGIESPASSDGQSQSVTPCEGTDAANTRCPLECPVCKLQFKREYWLKCHIERLHGTSVEPSTVSNMGKAAESNKDETNETLKGSHKSLQNHLPQEATALEPLTDQSEIPATIGSHEICEIRSSFGKSTDAVSNGSSLKCPVCEMQFKREYWFKCHMKTRHDVSVDPQTIYTLGQPTDSDEAFEPAEDSKENHGCPEKCVEQEMATVQTVTENLDSKMNNVGLDMFERQAETGDSVNNKNPLKCPVCEMQFRREYWFKCHIERLHGTSVEPSTVSNMGKAAESNKNETNETLKGSHKSLQNHLPQEATALEPLTDQSEIPATIGSHEICEIRSSFGKSTDAVSNGSSLKCPVCEMQFKREYWFKCHMKTRHDVLVDPQTIYTLGQPADSDEAFEPAEDSKENHGCPEKCVEQEMATVHTVTENLDSKMNNVGLDMFERQAETGDSVSNENPLKCPVCEMQFKREYWFKCHIERLHGTSVESSTESNQGKAAESNKNETNETLKGSHKSLQNHLPQEATALEPLTDQSEIPATIDNHEICEIRSSFGKSTDAVSNGSSLKCPVCEMQFKRKYWFSCHMKTRHGVSVDPSDKAFEPAEDSKEDRGCPEKRVQQETPTVQTVTENLDSKMNNVGLDMSESWAETGDLVSNKNPLKCPVCEMQFKREYWFKCHMKTRHDVLVDPQTIYTLGQPADSDEAFEPAEDSKENHGCPEKCVEQETATVHTVTENLDSKMNNVGLDMFERQAETGDSVSNKNPLKCPVCEMRFKREYWFKCHMENRHGTTEGSLENAFHDNALPKSAFRCDKCGIDYLKEKYFNRHLKGRGCKGKDPTTDTLEYTSKALKRYSDKLMDQESLESAEKTRALDDGTVQSEEKKTFKCDICNREFVYFASFDKHVKLHDSENKKKKRKRDSSAETLEKSNVSDLKSVFDVKKSACPEKKSKLETQVYSNNDNIVIGYKYNNFKCAKCDEEFPHLDDLQKHNESDHASQRCQHCEMKCSSVDELQSHLQIHTKPTARMMKIGCKICGKEVPSAVELIRHFRTHKDSRKRKNTPTQERESLTIDTQPAAESVRENSEKNSSDALKVKVIIETSVQKSEKTLPKKLSDDNKIKLSVYPCSICNKAFNNADKRALHMVRSHNDRDLVEKHSACKTNAEKNSVGSTMVQRRKIYTCSVCDRGFYKRRTRNDHTREHGITQSNISMIASQTDVTQLSDFPKIHEGLRNNGTFCNPGNTSPVSNDNTTAIFGDSDQDSSSMDSDYGKYESSSDDHPEQMSKQETALINTQIPLQEGFISRFE